MNQKRRRNKVCYVLSYRAPDYVRTRVLIQALSQIPDVEVYPAINSSKSVSRYAETLWRLLKTRIKYQPDVYILGFRGQELFWPVRFLTIGKPLIFDEFINMHDWLGEENAKLPGFLIKFADWYEKLALSSSRLILTDTKLGALKSSQTYNVPLKKFQAIYVGADENLFKPGKFAPKNKRLEVFFYGNMAPLHGLKIILEAAVLVKDAPVHFTIVGGKGKPNEIEYIQHFIKDRNLQNITHKDWAPFDELPALIAGSDLFLGGPFGNTSQAQRVITGKTFQALATGTPAVIGKINEQVGLLDKNNCLLTEQGSAAALAAVISWAVQHKDRLEEIGGNGRRLYEEKFSTSLISEQLRKIINEAI